MNFLYPHLSRGNFRSLITTAVIGALVAGAYGIVHDHITYAISPEYFTCFKFDQFNYADPGLGDRAFVVVIGFLATWWVGFFAGWFLWRLGVDPDGNPPAVRGIIGRFRLIIVCGVIGGISGFFYGRIRLKTEGFENWIDYTKSIGVEDHAAFMTVGQIHNFGYAGAFVGSVIAGVVVWRGRKR